jgi:hypothetical protein
MKIEAVKWSARLLAVLALAVSVNALAQEAMPTRFSGVISAYTPQSGSTGPYEIRGTWTLKLKDDGTKADFSAAVAMQESDGWVLTKNAGNFDPSARGAHTHHITFVGGDVVQTATGFQVTGTATITANGGAPPLPISPSMLTVNITGGTEVRYSNITLTFASPGSNHFGTEALPGVVRKVSGDRDHDRR